MLSDWFSHITFKNSVNSLTSFNVKMSFSFPFRSIIVWGSRYWGIVIIVFLAFPSLDRIMPTAVLRWASAWSKPSGNCKTFHVLNCQPTQNYDSTFQDCRFYCSGYCTYFHCRVHKWDKCWHKRRI